jgi:alkaline phosphatase
MYRKQFGMVAFALTVFATGAWAEDTAEKGPKNIIVMVGDGMGFAQVEAAGLYFHGDPKGQPFWKFNPLAMTTFSESGNGYDPKRTAGDFDYVRKGATDSAAAATTLSTGGKTLNKRIGQDADGNPLRHLYTDAEAMGKSTGVLSTVYLSHATPVSFAVHAKSRNDVEKLAQSLLRDSSLDLVIGAGHPWYDDDSKQVGGLGNNIYKTDGSYDRIGGEGLWHDIRDGKAGGDANGDGKADPWRLIDDIVGFEALAKDGRNAGRILGVLPVASTLQFNRGGDKQAAPYAVPPTKGLPDMALLVRGALNVLGQNPDGFFLMAEGGAIDWAGHGNSFGRLIEEQHDFDLAIAAVVEWVEKNSSWDDTLLVITADHETGYLCGPGSDPEVRPLENRGRGAVPGFEWHSKSHTNQLVPLFSKGNGADKFLDLIKGKDPRRGPYVDNADVPAVIRSVWR